MKPVALVSSVGGVVSPSLDGGEEKIESPDVGVLQGRLKNSESLRNLDRLLGHLPEAFCHFLFCSQTLPRGPTS